MDTNQKESQSDRIWGNASVATWVMMIYSAVFVGINLRGRSADFFEWGPVVSHSIQASLILGGLFFAYWWALLKDRKLGSRIIAVGSFLFLTFFYSLNWLFALSVGQAMHRGSLVIFGYVTFSHLLYAIYGREEIA